MYEFKNIQNRNITTGSWATEESAHRALVDFLQKTGLFYIYREVRGKPLNTCHFKQYHGFRADILALPSEKLMSTGWNSGALIFEVKRPGEKIGPAISQLLDYLHSAWFIVGGVAIVPTYAFVFSAINQAEAIGSVMAQNHIGTSQIINGLLQLYCGNQLVMRVWQNGMIDRIGSHSFGNKTGSR